jgi:hypothetical protein
MRTTSTEKRGTYAGAVHVLAPTRTGERVNRAYASLPPGRRPGASPPAAAVDPTARRSHNGSEGRLIASFDNAREDDDSPIVRQ